MKIDSFYIENLKDYNFSDDKDLNNLYIKSNKDFLSNLNFNADIYIKCENDSPYEHDFTLIVFDDETCENILEFNLDNIFEDAISRAIENRTALDKKRLNLLKNKLLLQAEEIQKKINEIKETH